MSQGAPTTKHGLVLFSLADRKLATIPFLQRSKYSLKEKSVIQLANRRVISFRIKRVIPFITDNICHIAISSNNCSFITKLLTLLNSFSLLLWEKLAQIKEAMLQLQMKDMHVFHTDMLCSHTMNNTKRKSWFKI